MSQVAQTILQQMGGNMFITMTGARNFLATENAITMQIAPNAMGVNYVTITLNGKDLYDMQFWRMRSGEKILHREANDIYFDQLCEIFTTETGLYTKL